MSKSTQGFVKGAYVHIIRPPHNSRRMTNLENTYDKIGVITRLGSSTNGGWYELRIVGGPNADKLVYYRRGSLELIDDEYDSDVEITHGIKRKRMEDDIHEPSDSDNSSQPTEASTPSFNTTSLYHIVNGDPFHAKRYRRKAINPTRSISCSYDDTPFSLQLLDTSTFLIDDHVTCGSCRTTVSSYWYNPSTNICSVHLCSTCGSRYRQSQSMCTYCHYVHRSDEVGIHRCPECHYKTSTPSMKVRSMRQAEAREAREVQEAQEVQEASEAREQAD